MAKLIIMYPNLRKYLQSIKHKRKFTYKSIADRMKLHPNVVHSWFWGYRFPRASNILGLAQCLSDNDEESHKIAIEILEIAQDEN